MIREHGIFPLMVYLFFAYSALTVIVGYAPIYFQYQGITETQIGWLMATGPLASVFAQPFWGYMSDKWKTIKRVLLICMGTAIAVSTIFFQMTGLFSLMFLMFCLFLFLAPCTALGDSLTQKTVLQRGLQFGSIRMWGSLGFATTSLITGMLLEQLNPNFLFLPFLSCALFAFGMIFFLQDAEPAQKPVTIIQAVTFGRRKEVVLFLAMLFFISIGHRANDSFLGLYIIELGGQESLVGRAWFIGVVSEALVFFLSFLWFRGFHPLFFIVLAGVLYAGRWFIMGTIDDPVYILWLQVFHGVTFGLMYFSSISYMTRIVPEELQATGHLLFITTFFGISGIAGALGGGWVMDVIGGSGLYLALGCFSLFGSVFLLFYAWRMNGSLRLRT